MRVTYYPGPEAACHRRYQTPAPAQIRFESVIGHPKNEHRMTRNRLAGSQGYAANAVRRLRLPSPAQMACPSLHPHPDGTRQHKLFTDGASGPLSSVLHGRLSRRQLFQPRNDGRHAG